MIKLFPQPRPLTLEEPAGQIQSKWGIAFPLNVGVMGIALALEGGKFL
jgi:hypothetical protein